MRTRSPQYYIDHVLEIATVFGLVPVIDVNPLGDFRAVVVLTGRDKTPHLSIGGVMPLRPASHENGLRIEHVNPTTGVLTVLHNERYDEDALAGIIETFAAENTR